MVAPMEAWESYRRPMTEDIAERQVTDAWRRIETWLREHAPATYGMLLPSASDDEIDTVAERIGVAVPEKLRTLWKLTGGVAMDAGYDSVFAGGWSLTHLEQVRMRNDPDGRPVLIQAFSLGNTDPVWGLGLDPRDGFLYRVSKFREDPPDEFDTLQTFLEETADSLEFPGLAARDKPGLVGGYLVWQSDVHEDTEGWTAFTG